MKKNIVLLFIALSQICIAATDTLNVNSKITDVTVFFSGAQITREVKLNLTKGKHTLFLDKLPQEVNPESIQVKGLDGLQILSVKHQYNFQSKTNKTAEEKALEKQIEALELELYKVVSAVNVYNTELSILMDNSQLSKDNQGNTVATIKEAADFYRSRLTEINGKKIELNEKSKVIKEDMKKVYAKINKLRSENAKTYSQIYISLECKQIINKTLSVDYIVNSAAWEPKYDFRVDEINKPLNLVYNAKVYQSTGEDWDGVSITLSSNNPTLSGEKPELIRWYVGRENKYNQFDIKKETSAISGNIMDAQNGENLPFANISLNQNGNTIAEVNSDFNGNYTIKPLPVGRYSVSVSYVGYNSVSVTIDLNANQTLYKDFYLYGNNNLREIEVINYKEPLVEIDKGTSGGRISSEEIKSMAVRSSTAIKKSKGINIRGARSNSSDTSIDGVKIIGSATEKDIISNSLNNNNNISYEILIPYTIKSDGEDNNIKIKEVDLKVDYLYKAVPKIKAEAFLMADITEWNKLNLLSGNSSIFYQGTFVGEAYLDVEQTTDTLSISLGRDQNVILKREVNKEISTKRIFGNNAKETQGLDLTIRNTKNVPIKIVIEDQYPLSDRDYIEVELLENSGAKVDKKEGKLSWNIELAPEETKKLTFSYSVKYPQ
ncbi:mucoidy inhibitor MuiA family protein [bacterium]|nr:mucoidy inhibitor MuiA family protein [bacterium]